MIKTLSAHEFVTDFEGIRPGSFTRPALLAIFDYLESLEEETGDLIEFDPIAICCDFTEYADLEEYQKDTGDDDPEIFLELDGDAFLTYGW